MKKLDPTTFGKSRIALALAEHLSQPGQERNSKIIGKYLHHNQSFLKGVMAAYKAGYLSPHLTNDILFAKQQLNNIHREDRIKKSLDTQRDYHIEAMALVRREYGSAIFSLMSTINAVNNAKKAKDTRINKERDRLEKMNENV